MKKEEKKKIIYKIFKKIFLGIFIGFSVLYFSQATGYYEYRLHEKVVLNQEQIEKFEQDIKDGKNIDIDEYTVEEVKDYSNSISNIGLKISDNIGETVKKSINSIFKYLSKMVEE